MPAIVMAASLEHIEETFDIRIRVSVRIFQRMTDAGLRREMDNKGKAVLRKQRPRGLAIGEGRTSRR